MVAIFYVHWDVFPSLIFFLSFSSENLRCLLFNEDTMQHNCGERPYTLFKESGRFSGLPANVAGQQWSHQHFKVAENWFLSVCARRESCYCERLATAIIVKSASEERTSKSNYTQRRSLYAYVYIYDVGYTRSHFWLGRRDWPQQQSHLFSFSLIISLWHHSKNFKTHTHTHTTDLRASFF